MANLWVRPDGDDLNGGSRDAAAALVTADATGGTLGGANELTDAGVDFVAAGVVAGDMVCLRVAGSDRRYLVVSVDSATQLTLSAGAGATYTGYRVGGAVLNVDKVANENAGFNVSLAAGDIVNWRTGSYARTTGYTFDCTSNGVRIRAVGGRVTFDGTGSAGTVDGITCSGGSQYIAGVDLANWGDIGFARTSGIMNLTDCRTSATGGAGITNNGGNCRNCRVSAPVGIGILDAIETTDCVVLNGSAEAVSITTGTANGTRIQACILADCTAGIVLDVGTTTRLITDNLIKGMSGICFDVGGASPEARLGIGSMIYNNIFSGGTYGQSYDSAQTVEPGCRRNLYYGQSTAERLNAPDDLEGWTVADADPLFVSAAGDDYRLQPSSPAYNTGLGAPELYPNIGAGPVVNDYPAVADVESGVAYAGSTLTGTLAVGGGGRTPSLFGYGF